MKKIFLLFTSFAVFLLFFKAAAQTSHDGSLTGNVIDEQRKPLDYVSIALLKAQDSTVVKGSFTFEKGIYAFDHLPDGNYLIAFNMLGYTKVVKGPFPINAGNRAYSVNDVLLTATAKQLNSVNITGKKPLVERQVDKTVLNIENSVLATGNTALEILRKAPGVSVDKDGNVSLRGKKGVTVMIDGKPTYLSNEELANLLNSTEGNAITSIELLTNPSSKYDASGNSGIINIKLKKNRNYGTNGTATAGGGYGKNYKANGGLTLNHREKKFNVFGDVNYGRNKRTVKQGLSRVNDTGTDQTFFDQTAGYTGIRNNTNYKTGLDYFINDNNTIGVAINGYVTKADQVDNILTRIGSHPNQTDSLVKAINPTQYKYVNTAYNLNYRGVLDTLGQEINVDLDFSRYHRDKLETYNNNFSDAAGLLTRPPVIFRNATPAIVKIWVAKADYSYPLNKKTKLDLGLKTSFVNTDNNSIFENFINHTWQNDVTQTNHFKYDENINAAYANLKREFRSTTLQLGLRAEQTNSKGNSVTTQNTVKRHYLNLFPTIFINQVLSRNNEIGFSYSRRIDRPDYSSLNPFVHFLDAFTYFRGNPFLNPQYTNSFEVSYSYKKTINATFGYSHTSDVISFVVIADTARKTLAASNENLAELNSYNLNISSPLSLARWWNTNTNLTVFYNKFNAPDLLATPFSSGKLSFNFNTTQTFTVTPTFNVELSGFYHSKSVNGTTAESEQHSIDLGFSKSLLEKKLNIKVAANDVFNLLKYKNTSTIPGQDFTYRSKDESRVFRLTCTYRFGSSEIKGARKRDKGSAEEQNRVKP
ncbi:outer membrane beta-barrel protein [Pedobacter hartonius]|uniref:Outer membrane receptor proteins, mostly Fe transport n=1 Tax=Pedobacter hartonius TaxID=425514 RepID=A0A1H3XN52_9SPHI|nr:outer membrane beta-barrel protein [Pedobacter hartonius]SDZ99968.1 Outer membrane receptor proteins, mostly Fe transport [Pedobacter hartonius]